MSSAAAAPFWASVVLWALAAAAIVFAAGLFIRFGRRGLYILLAVFLGAAACCLLLEAVGQIYLLFHPMNRVLYLQPDRMVGWREVPGFSFVNTSDYSEFRVPVRINSLGFRDVERREEKPPGVVRVALLGDSLVEALQVPLEKTAAQVLERKLNEWAAAKGEEVRYEVFNFGVSNYSLGQCLLLWEEYVSRYRPDFVVVYAAKHLMFRSDPYVEWTLGPGGRWLRIRPTFRLVDGGLVRVPAADYDEFVRAQAKLLAAGGREGVARSRQASILLDYLRQTFKRFTAMRVLRESDRNRTAIVALNLAILDELGRQVTGLGGRLVVADATLLHESKARFIEDSLRSFCREMGYGYVLLSADLEEERRRGKQITWPRDGHFNELGNEVFAEAVFQWGIGAH